MNLHVRRKEEQENPRTTEQGAGRPGRMPDTGASQMSALSETDWNQLAKDRFAHDIADLLYKEAHRGVFERIVLVAAPGTLGELRQEMHKEVADRLVAEVLPNQPRDEIEKHIAEAVCQAA